MDENKKKTLPEETTGSAAETVSSLNNVPEAAEKKKGKLKAAMIRAGAAFLVALLLLGVTQLAFIDMLRGATENEAVQDAELGSFIKRNIFAILGFYPDDGSEDTATSTYAVVPMSGKLVTVHFTKRYMESAESVQKATYDYINGNIALLDSYFVVEGTTQTLSEERSTQLYDWFASNKDWMVEAGVITDTDDNAAYLSDVVLKVDAVKGMNETLVLIFTGLAAALLLYFLVELVLMATGVYLQKAGAEKEMQTNDDSCVLQAQTGDDNATDEQVSEQNADDARAEDAAAAEQVPAEKTEDQEDQ